MAEYTETIFGVLLLDKPLGLSSHRVTQVVRRLFQAKKAGHTGSLDPAATGLLPICLGEATKFASYLLDADKTYHATVQFGVTTTTGDQEGAVLKRHDVTFCQADLGHVVSQYSGDQMQLPPMYSALKYHGKPLYQYARSGLMIERVPRKITVYHIEVMRYADGIADIFIHCSKGTYIRTLAEDIGRTLGCGASLLALQRTQIGVYCLDDAFSVETLENLSLKDRKTKLMPVDSLVTSLPMICLEKKQAFRFQQGQTVPIFEQSSDILKKFRVYSDTDRPSFVGIGAVQKLGTLTPIRLMAMELTV